MTPTPRALFAAAVLRNLFSTRSLHVVAKRLEDGTLTLPPDLESFDLEVTTPAAQVQDPAERDYIRTQTQEWAFVLATRIHHGHENYTKTMGYSDEALIAGLQGTILSAVPKLLSTLTRGVK